MQCFTILSVAKGENYFSTCIGGSIIQQWKNIVFNPLPDDKILDWSKLKQTADDILKCI